MIDPDDDIDTREPDTWSAGTWLAITLFTRVLAIAVSLAAFAMLLAVLAMLVKDAPPRTAPAVAAQSTPGRHSQHGGQDHKRSGPGAARAPGQCHRFASVRET